MRISKERITKFEKKIRELDPENVRKEFEKAIEKVGQLKKDTTEELGKIVDERTKGLFDAFNKNGQAISDFSNRFHAIQNRLAEQDKKIDEFISSTQKITQKALSRISGLVEEISALMPNGEKSKENQRS